MKVFHCEKGTIFAVLVLLSITRNISSFSPSASSSSTWKSSRSSNKLSKNFLYLPDREIIQGTSIINETLLEMENDIEYQETQQRLSSIGTEGMTKEERANRRRALNNLGIQTFSSFIREKHDVKELKRKECNILQINIGLYCNLACSHCHVESSPLRKNEMMDTETMTQCIELLKNTPSIKMLDITGGAPELNSNFRLLVSMAKSIRPDLEIIDRSNLVVFLEPGQEDLIDFLKEYEVQIIASLPCYSEENVDSQRGRGVFERSVVALQMLNEAGYGIEDSPYKLNLVYNPSGAFLPPPQEKLQDAYKIQLREKFNLEFHELFTITNMPIKRFADYLYRSGELEEYMNLLVNNFNIKTLDNIMCLDLISVGYDGKVYDCDFNQQLGLGPKKTVFDLQSFNDLMGRRIATDNHCFGCTAGMGSS